MSSSVKKPFARSEKKMSRFFHIVERPFVKDFKILLVDDHDMIRIMLKSMLGELGQSNFADAENGKEALDMLEIAHREGKPYDFVFCDWTMPIMTGIEFLQACRASESFAKLPIVMVTAEGEQQSIIHALRTGATDYMIKPLSPEVVERKLKKLLTRLSDGGKPQANAA